MPIPIRSLADTFRCMREQAAGGGVQLAGGCQAFGKQPISTSLCCGSTEVSQDERIAPSDSECIHRGLTPRVIKLCSRFAIMKANDATHNTTNISRRCVAVGKEIPEPVASATYAATHAGHLGRSASVALGMIQPAISPQRLDRHAARRASSPACGLV